MTKPGDFEHEKALQDTGFWGKKGAGSIVMARTTGRLLLQYRSAFVEQPHTWGTWGGAVDPGLSPESAAIEEFEEETGKRKSDLRDIIPLHVFKHESGFQYHNFLFVVDDEFSPRPSRDNEWEMEGFRWTVYGKWPKPLHFGLKNLIEVDGSKIEHIVKQNEAGRKLTEGLTSPRETTITLYHGTSETSARNLLANGWQPNVWKKGGNMGQTRYLYLTIEPEDARWFANEKGEDTVLRVKNVPFENLIVDPEDGIGDDIYDELDGARRLGLPAKFALKTPLPKNHFEVLK